MGDFVTAFAQLGDPRFRKVLIRALALTLLLLFLIFAGFVSLLGMVMPDEISLPWLGEVGFLDSLISWAAILLMIVLSVFLMFPVASLFVGFYLDEVVEAVEVRHYPELALVDPLPWREALYESLRFFGLMILANLLALIIYFISTIFAPFVFWAVNGFLLGREYFHLVASRRLGRKAADALRRKHFFAIWMTGILMAIPLSVPIVNLLVPVMGVAVFTHQYHRLSKQ